MLCVAVGWVGLSVRSSIYGTCMMYDTEQYSTECFDSAEEGDPKYPYSTYRYIQARCAIGAGALGF